jgi:hypothetical protein
MWLFWICNVLEYLFIWICLVLEFGVWYMPMWLFWICNVFEYLVIWICLVLEFGVCAYVVIWIYNFLVLNLVILDL